MNIVLAPTRVSGMIANFEDLPDHSALNMTPTASSSKQGRLHEKKGFHGFREESNKMCKPRLLKSFNTDFSKSIQVQDGHINTPTVSDSEIVVWQP